MTLTETPPPATRRARNALAAPPSRTLAVTAAATLLVLAVFSAVVTTVGDTARSVHAGVGGQTWALSGMSLGLATALLTVGALADDLGRRRVLVWSAGLLAITSALAAVAPTMDVFVAARVLQGVAGAGVLATSLAALGHAFPDGAARTHATGVWGAAVGGGIALGPVAGAALTAALGWRSGYWLQAVAAAALVPAAAAIDESRAAVARPLDVPGVATLGAGMACVTAGLIEGRQSWTAVTTIAFLAGGALLLAAFAALELRRRAPMVDLRLLREPLFFASVDGALFTGLAVIGLMSFSPTLMHRGLGISALGSGAVLATWSATSMVVALGARRLPSPLASHARLAIGLAVCAVGEAALTGLGTGSSWARLVPGLVVAGVGSGMANAALGRLAVESVPRDRAGMGSGANNTARYLGGAAGVAVVVAVVSAAGGAGGAIGLVHGWNTATLVCASLCAAGALIAAFSPRR
jgi:MFS family permease